MSDNHAWNSYTGTSYRAVELAPSLNTSDHWRPEQHESEYSRDLLGQSERRRHAIVVRVMFAPADAESDKATGDLMMRLMRWRIVHHDLPSTVSYAMRADKLRPLSALDDEDAESDNGNLFGNPVAAPER